MLPTIKAVRAWDGRDVSIGERVSCAFRQLGDPSGTGVLVGFVSAGIWIVRWDTGDETAYPADYLVVERLGQ